MATSSSASLATLCLLAQAVIVQIPAVAAAAVGANPANQPITLAPTPPPITGDQRIPVFVEPQLDGIPADAPQVAPGVSDPADPESAVAGAAAVPLEGQASLDAFADAPSQGTHVALVYPADVNDQGRQGYWHDIWLALTATTGGWSATLDGITVSFPSVLSEQTPITSDLADGSIAIAPVGVEAAGTSDGTTVTYADALPGVDLIYRAVPGGYSEQVVFKSAAASTQLSYAIHTSGLSLARNEGGGLDIYGVGGVWVGWLPTPVAYDSSPEPAGSVPATTFTDLGGGSYSLDIALDPTFMASATYPVALDPQVDRNPSRDGYTNSANPDTSYEGSSYLKVGSGIRSFLRFDIDSLQNDGRLVYDATMFLYPTAAGDVAIDAKRVTDSWPAAGNLDWNHQPPLGQIIDTASSPTSQGWWSWQLKELYQHYIDPTDTYNTHWPDYGVGLSASNAKTFYSTESGGLPVLYITYNDRPGQPTPEGPGTGPGDQVIVETPSPTLRILGGAANWPDDPNGDEVLVNFQISDDGANWEGSHLVYESPFNDTHSFTVPAGVLTDGQRYWWRAQSADICAPPDGLCLTKDGAGTDHGHKHSAPWSFTVSLKHLGDDQRYAMWSRDVGNGMTMKVNESGGNLFLDVPLDTYQTPIGPISVGLTYNSLESADYGLSPGWDLAIGPSGSARDIPIELVKLEQNANSDVKIRFRAGKTLFFPHKDGNIYGATGAGSGTVRRAGDGSWTYIDADGGVFTFLPSGRLDRAMPAWMSPSAAGRKSIDYTYNANNNLGHVEDPLGRAIDLSWSSGSLQSITATGFGGEVWNFTYNAANGRLNQIHTTVTVPPSSSHKEVLDFRYQSDWGLLNSVKNGQIQGQVLGSTSGVAGWTITYLKADPADDPGQTPRVATVRAPDGNAASVAPPWNFGYYGPYKGTTAAGTCVADPRTSVSGAWCDVDYGTGEIYQTQVDSDWAGLPIRITAPPDQNGYRRVQTYVWDSNLNMLCERDPVANAFGWNALNGPGCTAKKDNQGNYTNLDPDGLSTRYTYENDPPYRMLTVKRPAPDLTAYPRLKESYAYDSGASFQGLWVEKYGNPQMAGLPDDENTWTDFNVDWGSGAPPGVPGDGNDWSLRWTGWLDLTSATDTNKYAFRIWSADGVNLTIGGRTLLSCLGTETSAADYNCGTNADVKKLLSPGLKPITIEYSALQGAASFQLKWDQGNGTWAVMQGSQFQPNLGLVTSETHSRVTATGSNDLYQEVWTYPDDDKKARHLPETYRRTDLSTGGPSYMTGYDYNKWGQTTSVTTALGTSKEATTTSEYTNGTPPPGWVIPGQVSCLSKTTGPLGEVSQYRCNQAGDIFQTTASVPSVTGTYLTQPQQDRITTSTFDSLGRVVKVVGPSGGTTTTTYDLAGRVLTTDTLYATGLHALTDNTWDAAGRLHQVQGPDPDGASPYANRPTTIYDYDWADNLDAMTDPLSKKWTYDQDALDRRTSVTSPLGAKTTTTYQLGSAVNRIVVTDPAGAFTTTDLDVLGRKISEALGSYAETAYTYDVLGNVTKVTDPAGIQTKSTYDNLSELSDETEFFGTASAAITTYAYDGAGQLKEVDGPRTDVDDRIQYAHDLSRRLTTITQPGVMLPDAATAPSTTPSSVSITYDDAGERVEVTQPMRTNQTLTRDWTYRADGEVASSADSRGTTTYTRNLAGWLTQTADPRPQNEYFGYDALGRRICRYSAACTASTTGAETYQYDKAGHMTQAKNANATYNMSYDADGRLYQVKRGTTLETTYTYDPKTAQLSSVADAAGTTGFTYNTNGQIWKIDDPLDTTANQSVYTYDPTIGRLIGRTDAQATLTWGLTYEPDSGRLDTEVVKKTGTASVLSSFDLDYDPAGNLTRKVAMVSGNAANGAWTYTYDGASRMTRAIGPNATGASITRDYRYDGAGNRIYVKEGAAAAVSTTYDLSGLPTTSTDGTTYTHDQIGDLKVIDRSGTANDWSYNYDAYGRMICAKNSITCSGTGTITFTLDALDRLLSRVGTTTTAYTWSGLSEDPAKTVEGKTTTYYAYTRSGSPLAQKAATLGFYLSDPHGDIVGTAAAGAVSGSRSYDPWGKPLATSGSSSYLGYQGDPTDPSTGQVDMGARNYEPSLGRFSTRDVLFGDPTSPMSLNQFVYATDSPITFTDPTGMLPYRPGYHRPRHPADDGGDVSVETPTASWPDPEPIKPPIFTFNIQFLAALFGSLAGGAPGPGSPGWEIPAGAWGPLSTRTGLGYQYNYGQGGPGLAENVTDVRFVPPGSDPKYPGGYVNWGSRQANGGWQPVNPRTGESVGKDDPWWHRVPPENFRWGDAPQIPPPGDDDPPSGGDGDPPGGAPPCGGEGVLASCGYPLPFVLWGEGAPVPVPVGDPVPVFEPVLLW